MNEFTDTLCNAFDLNQPIMVAEINKLFPNVSKVTVYKWIEEALSAKKLRKFRRGVYYLPKEGGILGLGEIPLSPDLVIQKQYIKDGERVFGYRSGLNLENEIGVSPQVPATLEITTNKASKRVRSIEPFGGYREITLRKPRLEITNENVDALRFLDLITRVPLEGITTFEKARLKVFAQKIQRDSVLECLGSYPAKTSKKLIESEYLDVFAR